MGQITSIQVLRAIAALVVVIGHAQHDAAVTAARLGGAFGRSFLLPWGAGVDLFFVISGFIMVHASRDLFARPGGARQFLIRRSIRIVPLYWLFASLYLALQVLVWRLEGKPLPAPLDIAASYLFIPVDTFLDGFPRPFFTLGWSLNYEMFFYLVFAALLLLPRFTAVLGVLSALVLLTIAGALTRPGSTILNVWTSPIILEFALGAAIALARAEGLVLGKATRAILIGLGSALLMRDYLFSDLRALDWITANDFARLLAWGLPAAMIIAGATLEEADEEASRLLAPVTRAGLLLGDASYALYLSHPFVVVLVRKLALAGGAYPVLGPWGVIATTLLAACAIALLTHHLIEKPMIAALRKRFEPRARDGLPRLSAKPA